MMVFSMTPGYRVLMKYLIIRSWIEEALGLDKGVFLIEVKAAMDDDHQLELWNPWTRKSRPLLRSPIHPRAPIFKSLVGFGFEPSSN